MGHSQEALVTYIYKHAGADLRTLHMLGGRGLHRLGMDLYIGFGQNPGKDEIIAQYLSRLPMQIDNRLPSFMYQGRSLNLEPLLVAHHKKYIHSVGFTIRSEIPGPANISPACTPIVEAMIDGVKHLHAAMGVNVGRGNLYLHLLSITDLTARRKGLTW